jgi:Tfp pilus assembly PilM family ATPase
VFERKSIFPIGIDIGTQSLFAVQLQQMRQGPAVRGLFHKAFDKEAEDPAEAGELMLPRLKEIVKSKRFSGKKAAVHLPSHDILSFPIRFKCDRPQDLEAAILQESKKYLPFPIEEAIIDYPSVTADSILAQHYVPWGMQALIEKIATNLALSDGPRNVRILLKNYGLSFDTHKSDGTPAGLEGNEKEEAGMRRVIHHILTPNMEALIHEFHKLIGYVRSEEQNSTFEKIFLYGQGAFIRDMGHYLAGRLDIPTQLINPFTKVTMTDDGIIDNSEGGPFALAMGLAMRKVSWL